MQLPAESGAGSAKPRSSRLGSELLHLIGWGNPEGNGKVVYASAMGDSLLGSGAAATNYEGPLQQFVLLAYTLLAIGGGTTVDLTNRRRHRLDSADVFDPTSRSGSETTWRYAGILSGFRYRQFLEWRSFRYVPEPESGWPQLSGTDRPSQYADGGISPTCLGATRTGGRRLSPSLPIRGPRFFGLTTPSSLKCHVAVSADGGIGLNARGLPFSTGLHVQAASDAA